MWTLFYGKPPTILTTLGGVKHRHIVIVMQETLYANILPMYYTAPVDLGGTAKVPEQATKTVSSQLRDEHVEIHHIHENHNNIDAALNNMVLKAVDSTYIFALHNVSTGYMG